MGFHVVQFLTGLSGAAGLFLVAAGLSLIFGVTRIVNFAHGSFYMIGAYAGLGAWAALGGGVVGWWGGVLLAGLAAGLVGVLVELLILRRIYRSPELFQLVATFGVILVVQDLALMLWGPEDRLGPRAPGLSGSVEILGSRIPEYDLFLIAASPVVLLALWLLLNRTRWGVLVRAATQDREMLGALGVNQSWLFTGVFFLGCFLAGLGGALQLPVGGANLLMDLNIIALAFVVVVIGGMGSIGGAFLAALVIGELNAFGILVFPRITLVLAFLVMAVVLVFRPRGFFGRAGPEEGEPAGPAEPVLRPAPRRWRLAGLALLLLLVSLPLWVGPWVLVLVTEMAIFALFAASLHFIMGPGGMVSFGHAAYFGGGAYAAALLFHHAGLPMEVLLLAAPVLAGLLALVFGWFCVRLGGVYLAMLTLAFAQIAWSVVFQWTAVTGGSDGILGIWPPAWASGRAVFYWLTLTLCSAAILALRHMVFSPFGFALRAGRDSPRRAVAIGIDVRRQRWFAFALAGAFAGLAGALFVFAKGSVFPDEMSIPRSFDALIMLLLGGVQTLSGPVVGAGVFTWLQDTISRLEIWRLVLGTTIILIVVVAPRGIVGTLRERFGRQPAGPDGDGS